MNHFSCEPCDVFLHTKPVYGLSVDVTNDQVFATAGEDGLVLMFDLRVGTHILTLPKSRASYHAVQFHPSDGNTIITANEKDGAALWDLRDSKQLVSFPKIGFCDSHMLSKSKSVCIICIHFFVKATHTL